jgi:hypothetical protein
MYFPKFAKKISFGKATSSDYNPIIIGGHIHETKINGTQSGIRNNLLP